MKQYVKPDVMFLKDLVQNVLAASLKNYDDDWGVQDEFIG